MLEFTCRRFEFKNAAQVIKMTQPNLREQYKFDATSCTLPNKAIKLASSYLTGMECSNSLTGVSNNLYL